ncbi:MAG TPA: MFS transporter [Pseudolabrys sp.]|nr:MFS transporter [Pseudolabrys sp.]
MSNLETAAMPAEVTAASSPIETRAIAAASLGTAIEFYDVFLYLYFSLTIAKLFFPASNEWVSLLATVGAFAVSYLTKPLGALFFSSYADRVSRKAALTATLSCMAAGIAVTAAVPTYQTIGIAATLIMIGARVIQGFSSGGEYGAATAFLAERAPADRRGFYASFQIAALGLTSILGGLSGVLVSSLMTQPQIEAGGWRVPFVFGLTIIPVALYLRRIIPESSHRAKSRAPLTEAVAGYTPRLIIGMGSFALVSIANYALAFYLPTYAIKNLGLPPSGAFAATIVIGSVQAVLSPFFGHLSDRYGRARVMLFGAAGMAIVTLPAFLAVVSHPTVIALMCSQFVLAILLTAYQAPMPAFLCDLFPPAIRTTGVAIVHDFTATFVGAFTPFMTTLLIGLTGSNLVPGFYVGAAAVLGFVCVMLLRSKLQRL